MAEADERESPTDAADETGTEVADGSAGEVEDVDETDDADHAPEPDLSALAHPSAAPAEDDEAGLLDLSAFRAAAGKVEADTSAPAAPTASAAPVPVVAETPQATARAAQGGSGTPIILAGLFIGAGIALGGYFLKGAPADVPREPVSASTSVATSGEDERRARAADEPPTLPSAEAGRADADDTTEQLAETQGSASGDAPEASAEGATPSDAARDGSGSATSIAAASRMASTQRSASTMVAASASASASMTAEASASMATPSMQRTERDLLAAALGDGASAMAEMPAPEMEEAAPALPEEPSRADVRRALSPLMPAIRRCAQDQVGVATARIRVRSNGSVESATIGGSPFGGTPQGECMARAVRRAHFRPFRRPSYSLSFPFAIRPR